MSIWEFIQDQVLGMKWLNKMIGSMLSSLGLDISGRVRGQCSIFIYDVNKNNSLALFPDFMISYIRVISLLSQINGFWAVFMELELILFQRCWGL